MLVQRDMVNKALARKIRFKDIILPKFGIYVRIILDAMEVLEKVLLA